MVNRCLLFTDHVRGGSMVKRAYLSKFPPPYNLLETDVVMLLLFDNVGAGAGALLCPLKTIDIGPFSSVAKIKLLIFNS